MAREANASHDGVHGAAESPGPPRARDLAPHARPARAAQAEPAGLANAMTVDVEDYYQVSAFAHAVDPADWPAYPSRVERNVGAVLQMFAQHGVRATFFTLGWIAERHPALIRRLVAGGHELASHGWQHVRVPEQPPEAFRADVRRTKRVLEDIGGVPVQGYRAASFSIGETTPWAFEILAEEGYAYSSSIYPIRHDLYGMPWAPRFAFRPPSGNGLIEIPLSTTTVFGHNLPCGGGGYFRLLPYGVSRWAMRRVNGRERQPCIFFFHPWEIDPEQPRFAGVSLKTRFRHYTNLRRMERRLRAALADFAWDRMDRIFLTGGGGTQDPSIPGGRNPTARAGRHDAGSAGKCTGVRHGQGQRAV